jgi:single-strand DNA-binding protein
MADIITITGLVATAPRHVITAEGLAITSFRLASSQRRYDRANQKWIDGDTNWYSITAFRQLAVNAAGSVSKGDRIIVTGRLRVREWDTGEKQGVNVDVEADALGHDLTWGTSQFSRTIASTSTNTESGGSASGGAEGPGSHAGSADGSAPAEDAGDGSEDHTAPAHPSLTPEPALPF